MGRAFALSVAVIAVPGVARSQDAPPDSIEVERLTFEGNESFPASTLRNAIETDATHCRSAVLYPFCWLGGDWAIERRTLVEPELPRDIARIRLFYFRRGYREARVDTLIARNESQVRVTFSIDEGRPVRVGQVSVEGNVTALDDRAIAALPLRSGAPLSLLELESTRDRLLRDLGNSGYARAEVLAGFSIPATTPYTASVTFQVLPGPLSFYGPIDIDGNRDLSDASIRSLMPIQEGAQYSDAQLAEAQQNLFDLDIVRHVEILQTPRARSDSIVPLQVRLNEAGPHRVRASGGFSTFRCLNVDASWASRNFKGGGRTLRLSGQLWNGLANQLASSVCTQAGTGRYGQLNYRIGADFLQPVIGSPKNSLSTGIFFERESFPDVFIRQTLGADLLFARNIGRLSATGLSYRPQFGRFDAAEVYFCANFLICSAEEIAAVSAASMLAPVGIQLSADRTTPFGNPLRGWTGLIAFEHAGTFTLSDYTYDRLILEGSSYKEVGRGTQRVLATRVRTGYLRPDTFGGLTTESTDLVISSPSKRFYTGGATTVRGFGAGRLGPRSLQTDVRNLVAAPDDTAPGICTAEEVLDLTCDANPLDANRFTDAPAGGNLLLLGNLEYRTWVSESLQATLFVDFGQVWSTTEDFNLGDLEFTPGFGVRYPTPIGPLRLDLAYNFRTSELLPTLTAQLKPLDPDNPQEVVTVGADGTQYVISDELAPLMPTVRFGTDDLWSLSRFQLHFSVGQAF